MTKTETIISKIAHSQGVEDLDVTYNPCPGRVNQRLYHLEKTDGGRLKLEVFLKLENVESFKPMLDRALHHARLMIGEEE